MGGRECGMHAPALPNPCPDVELPAECCAFWYEKKTEKATRKLKGRSRDENRRNSKWQIDAWRMKHELPSLVYQASAVDPATSEKEGVISCGRLCGHWTSWCLDADVDRLPMKLYGTELGELGKQGSRGRAAWRLHGCCMAAAPRLLMHVSRSEGMLCTGGCAALPR
jgi:hypothetical protein